MTHDRRCDTTEKQALYPGVTVRTHYDQVRLPFSSFVNNFGPRITLSDFGVDLESFLLEAISRLLRQVARTLLHFLIYAFETFAPAIPGFQSDLRKRLGYREHPHSCSFWPGPFSNFSNCQG